MEPVTLFEEREIKVRFDLGGHRLIPGCSGVLGEPIEHFLELYAVSADHTVRISSPTDLARITRAVRSPAEALEFVRLFTSPRTHYLFDRERVSIDLVVAGTDPRGFGVIGRELAQRLALPPDHVSSEAAAFRIDRCLVGAESPSAARTVLARSERVFHDGRYELVSEQAVASLGADEVTLPSYE
jgi:hypothetical protein